jgi:16S rRNA (cytosine1402-N4)-methyltransferase
MSMPATNLDEPSFFHVSVLLTEVTQAFEGVSGLVLDVTAGGGGHSHALLAAHPNLEVVACDRDLTAVAAATERLEEFGERARVVHASFSELDERLTEMGIGELAGIVADLGVSSEQLGSPERGMSFRKEGPLDMRMDPTRGETALELIERLSQDDLANVIYELGEERASRRVARCIKQALERGELATTLDLRRAVVRAMGPRRVGGVDPATRTFQALRMAVNGEVDELRTLLAFARERLQPGGVAALISFHSLEDRLVKREFAKRDDWQRRSGKPVIASDEEQAKNPRSRSAKLRVASRVEALPSIDFAEDE